MHQIKSNICTCGATKVAGLCPRGCNKKEAKVPKWMQKSAKRLELNQR